MRPSVLFGYKSPNPTVEAVTTAHQIPSKKVGKEEGSIICINPPKRKITNRAIKRILITKGRRMKL
jgi:hypothetical protein